MANETKHPNGVDLQNQKAINLADPVDPQDAATKIYTDIKVTLDGVKATINFNPLGDGTYGIQVTT